VPSYERDNNNKHAKIRVEYLVGRVLPNLWIMEDKLWKARIDCAAKLRLQEKI
jgi:hypothetical protein